MILKSTRNITFTLLVFFAANAASAATVNWQSLGLEESLLLSPSGQTVTDFSGISGLDAVVTGSSNLRQPTAFNLGNFTHVSGNLHLRTGLADNNPISITFEFNRYVTFSAEMFFFGDAGIQEEFRWSSNTGIFDATVSGDNGLFDDMTSLVRITSGSNAVSDLAQVSSNSVKDITIALGGAGFTGLAGSTVSMDLEVATVPVPAAIWLFGSGFIGLIGIARRKKA